MSRADAVSLKKQTRIDVEEMAADGVPVTPHNLARRVGITDHAAHWRMKSAGIKWKKGSRVVEHSERTIDLTRPHRDPRVALMRAKEMLLEAAKEVDEFLTGKSTATGACLVCGRPLFGELDPGKPKLCKPCLSRGGEYAG